MTAVKEVKMYPVTDASTDAKEPKENYGSGYVSLYRSIRNHWIWQDAEKLKWWLDILLEVNHTPKKVLLGGALIECKKGQSLNSLATWAKQWRTNISAVRRFFKLLESDGMIVTENVSKTTRLTVCKYESYQELRQHEKTEKQTTKKNVAKNGHESDTKTTHLNDTESGSYQGVRNDDETEMKRRRNGNETQATTNNNDNNDNKGKGAFRPPSIDDVEKYITDQLNGHHNAKVIAENFMNFYSANGWKVGKNKMADWKATVRNSFKWEKNQILISQKKVNTTTIIEPDDFYGRPAIKPAY